MMIITFKSKIVFVFPKCTINYFIFIIVVVEKRKSFRKNVLIFYCLSVSSGKWKNKMFCFCSADNDKL
jgi:hypothetical protein